MPARMPVVFVSHGAPDALLKSPEVVRCWIDIGQSLPPPRAILAVSAHWETRVATASLAGVPATIHDFSGFSPALYQMQYGAPGAPDLAERVAQLTGGELHPSRGLDHGAWVPLKAMFPQASIPVTQLSVTHQSPETHLKLGQALSVLRDEGVLILASGAITHNFAWIDWQTESDAPPLPQALAFSDWVAKQLRQQNSGMLCDYRAAPHGAAAHPTAEHFMPLLVAMGAGDASPSLHRLPFAYRGLSMDAYVWQ